MYWDTGHLADDVRRFAGVSAGAILGQKYTIRTFIKFKIRVN